MPPLTRLQPPTFSLLCHQCLPHKRRPPITLFRHLSTTTSETPDNTIPITADFQKSQKRALKERHKASSSAFSFSPSSPWEVTCGLEVHAQLNTVRKLFSYAKTSTTAPPNSHISLIDAALPGTQPTLNPTILLPALRAALALQCTPSRLSRFDRKHYFYWDQPAGYQITQFYQPLARDGRLVLTPENDGVTSQLELKIRQVQIEQDTGKTIAAPPNSLVDLNRVGAPLVEIITDPFPLDAAETAGKVLAKIQAVLRAVDACVLGMEWGGLRADVNVSTRRRGDTALGQRCEIKNLSSFKAVTDAITAEATRQIGIVEAGGEVQGETRGWDAENSTTRRLRGKEGEVDYRYMPEPDLPAVVLAPDLLEMVKVTMPLLPDQIIEELSSPAYGLSAKDARTLLLWDEGRSGQPDSVVAFYKKVVSLVVPATPAVGKVVGNWVIHELGGLLTTRELSWAKNPVEAYRLADLVSLIVSGKITGPTAKALLPRLFTETSIPSKIVAKENLGVTLMSDAKLEAVVKEVLETEEGKNVVKQLLELKGDEKKGSEKKRKGLRGFVVGKVMRTLGGKVKAERVEGVLDGLLVK
ncbi:Glutamyl-tRNA amidotransferase B subunit [Wilcoxina mikolae CBS 423.85]|nr:Glutamyl-tRNA amidotransferase B subunit [Wilcoxina mikolae CBS 423.85]